MARERAPGGGEASGLPASCPPLSLVLCSYLVPRRGRRPHGLHPCLARGTWGGAGDDSAEPPNDSALGLRGSPRKREWRRFPQGPELGRRVRPSPTLRPAGPAGTGLRPPRVCGPLRPPHGPVRATSCFSPFPAEGKPRLREGGPASQRASDPKLASCPAGFGPHHVGRGWRGRGESIRSCRRSSSSGGLLLAGFRALGVPCGGRGGGRFPPVREEHRDDAISGSRRGTGAAGEGEASLRR